MGLEALSYHHYTTDALGYEGDDVEAGFRRALGPVLDTDGINQKIWMTEGSNTPGSLPGNLYHHSFPATDFEQLWASADALARWTVAMLAAGNDKIFLYSMHTHEVLGGEHRFPTLITQDGFLHPDAGAFANLTWLLEGKDFVRRAQDEASGATLYEFADTEGQRVTVVAPARGWPVDPGEGEALDLWGNPLQAPCSHVFYRVHSSHGVPGLR